MFTTRVTRCSPELALASQWPLALVFDCDGLLIDSSRAWSAAYRAIASEFGRGLSDLDLARLHGASVPTAAGVLSEQLGQTVGAQLLQELLIEAFVREPPLAMPGARTLLRRLTGRVPLAVASNAPSEIVRAALRRAGLLDFFSALACADSVRKPKPAPDVYLRACRNLGAHPSDAIAFEDSLVGAQAAAAAGLVVVGVGAPGAARRVVDLAVASLADPLLVEFLRC